ACRPPAGTGPGNLLVGGEEGTIESGDLTAQVLKLGVVVVTFFAYPSKFGAFGAYGGAGVDDVDTGTFGATLDVPAFQPGQGQVGVLGGPVVVVVGRGRLVEDGFGLQGVVGGGRWWVRGFGQVECGGVRG